MGALCSGGKIEPRKHSTKELFAAFSRIATKKENKQFVLLDKEAQKLLDKKMKDKNSVFTSSESILLLSNLVEVGLTNAKTTFKKDLLIVIGNTGAGKSTCVNFLLGCEMER